MFVVPVAAQEPATQESSDTESGVEATPVEQAQAPLGFFHVGALYLTPYIRVSSLGFDTNVFYTPSDRQADFTVSGGPGLELILPVKQGSRATIDSLLDYMYFARTESERRLNGSVSGRFEYDPEAFDDAFALAAGDFRPAASAWIEESVAWTSQRYSYEIDERVPRQVESTRGELFKPLFGRMGVELIGSRARSRVLETRNFYGVDLERTMNTNGYLGEVGLRHYLTIFTTLRARVQYTHHEFPQDGTRDADSIGVRAGFETERSALIQGHAYVGHRWFKPSSGALPDRELTEFDIDGMWRASSKTELGGGYRRVLDYSVLAASGTLPTQVTETATARINSQLWGPLGIRLFGRRLHFVTDSPVELETPSGTETARREDIAWEAGANLGWSFSQRVRVGVEVTYSDRRSNFDDLGVDGLLFGLTVDVLTPLTERLDPRRRY